MGEDQHAAGLRGLHEAERGDGLAGAGRVLEPEALGGVGVLGLLGEGLLLVLVLDPVAGLLLGVALAARAPRSARPQLVDQLVLVLELVLVLLVLLGRGALDRAEIVVVLVVLLVLLGLLVLVLVLVDLGVARAPPSPAAGVARPASTSSGPRMSAEASSSGEAEAAARPLPSGAARCASASSAVSVPDSASTWWAESTVPSASLGSSSESSRSRPSSSENSRRHAVEGCLAFGSAVELGQRLVERAPARACRGRARRRDPRPRAGSARARASPRARFPRNLEWARPRGPLRWTRPLRLWTSRRSRRRSGFGAARKDWRPIWRRLPDAQSDPALTCLQEDIARRGAIEVGRSARSSEPICHPLRR